ncbi:MAG: ribonuclease P [Candidatus Micrarchaeota archaeon]|nr:ribonuclease P [Candidatus Micrarchaeota archaeon]
MKNADLMGSVASRRIKTLMRMAEERILEKKPAAKKLAQRYVKLALKISEHYKSNVPGDLKHRICKKCGNFLVPGINCTVRLVSSHGYAVYVCECGNEEHVFYKKRR